MNPKLLFLLCLLLLPLSFSLAGNDYALTEINTFSVNLENNSSCAGFYVGSDVFTELKGYEGILALDLYFDFTPNIDSKSFVSFNLNGEEYNFKDKAGMLNKKEITYSNMQNGRYVLDLENYRTQDDLNLEICGYVSGSVNTLALNDKSSIGSFKIPYFGCEDCFSKTLDTRLFMVGDIVEATINAENKGFESANIKITYNNYDVNTEIKILGGELYFEGNLGSNKEKEIVTYFKSNTDKFFIIPPARIEYTFDGYNFSELSNYIIVNAKNYLDDIECNLETNGFEFSIDEDVEITLSCFNKSADKKEFNVMLNISDQKVYNQKITLESKETKDVTVNYSFDNFDEKELCGLMYLDAEENKDLGCNGFYFVKDSSGYLIYILGLIVIIVFGIFIYYQFFL